MWMPLFAFASSTAKNFSTDIFVTFIGFFFSTTTFAGTSNAASKEPGLGLVDVRITFTGTLNAASKEPGFGLVDLRIDAFLRFNGFFLPAIAPATSSTSSASVGAEFVQAHIVRGFRASISQRRLKLDPGIPSM